MYKPPRSVTARALICPRSSHIVQTAVVRCLKNYNVRLFARLVLAHEVYSRANSLPASSLSRQFGLRWRRTNEPFHSTMDTHCAWRNERSKRICQSVCGDRASEVLLCRGSRRETADAVGNNLIAAKTPCLRTRFILKNNCHFERSEA